MTDPIDSAVIEQQLRHRSVRRFLDVPVGEAQLERIVEAAQRASTSSNLQAWSVIAIRDPERKRRLSQAIGGRDYVERAPVFLVWVADLARNAELLRAHGAEPETLGLIENTLLGAVDVGIAAQNALLAAESLGLGGVFVGGIRNAPEAVSAELRLPRHAFAIAGMALGTPDPEEGTGIKPRLPLSGVLHAEVYDPERWREATGRYEQDYRDYFETQGVPDRSWARTVVSRLGSAAGLHGRHAMRASLRAQGFDSE
ncbi:nitroreductase family protein [Leucobacter weissii]|uniref:Nitroreductase family protein n=1 Tax=Leucobacter weissii TaxID=1983706 RepID=A0A939MKP3_9MICO|nr:nitroreductase family protein [Leucobacter weissii]MBO1902748.1 nitroreductase family protein [Leucobacter weissii]